MYYSLRIWTNPGNPADIRIYIDGTTRTSVYFTRSDFDGRLVWSSNAIDASLRRRTGDYYTKKRKDGEAAARVADAFGVKLGTGTGEAEWDRLLQIVADGIQLAPKDDDDDDDEDED